MGSPRNPERLARAARLGDYFALQLSFADHLAAAAGLPFDQVVARYTNFRKRFGLGDDAAATGEWTRFLTGLGQCATAEARVVWTQGAYAAHDEPGVPPGQTVFGCFACEALEDTGVLRLHFVNREPAGGPGPLSQARRATRLAELAALFAFARGAHPRATRVHGASWLYHLDAYRRLFPAPYGQSRHLPEGPVRLTGKSSWGQFLDHHGAVKPDLRDRFVSRFDAVDPEAPWRIFPLPALRAEAPIGLFHDFYRRLNR